MIDASQLHQVQSTQGEAIAATSGD